MSQVILTQDKVEHLLTLMERRLRKLDSKALLELEQLTRNPQQLTGFVATSTMTATSPASPQSPPITQAKFLPDYISRRQLLIGIGTAGAVGTLGGGAYMLGAGKARRNAEQYARLDGIVQTATDQLNPKVDALARRASVVEDTARDLRDIASNCIKCYHGMRVALGTWWTRTVVVQQDYQAMQLVEGGVKALVEILSMLAALPKIAIESLELFSVELGDFDAFRAALQAVSDLLTHLDPALQAADEAHDRLDPWFSDMDTTDIERRLLSPLQDEFCPSTCNLATQCTELQEDWGQLFVQPVNEVRQQQA